MKYKSVLISLILLLNLVCVFGTGEGLYQEGVLYIKLKNSANQIRSDGKACRVHDLLPQKDSTMVQRYAIKEYAQSMRLADCEYLDDVYRIEFDSIRLIDQLMEDLKADSRIELVERVPLHTVPVVKDNDPINGYLIQNSNAERDADAPNDFFWGVVDGVQTSWFWDVIGFDDVYGKYYGSPDIKVAIVDNAVWEGHEDLHFEYDNLFDLNWGIEGSAAPPRQSSQDPYGWSHGTHCAGVVGALTENELGVASLASGVTLMGVKTAENSSLALERTVGGVIWAVENGAKVVNMSFGSSIWSQIEKDIFESFVQEGIILIAAAGNNAQNIDFYPAQYNGVISVASVNSDLKKSDFSNYGQWVDIAAPGGYYVDENGKVDTNSQILSTTFCTNQTLSGKPAFAGKYYDMMAGTSMAAPVVTSLASLIVSYYPDINAYQLLEVLQKSSTKVNQNDLSINRNSGVVNAPAAMKLLEESQNKYVNGLKARLNVAQTEVALQWSMPEYQADIIGYNLYENDRLIAEDIEELSYTIPYEDSMKNSYFGVKTVYENDEGLIAHTKVVLVSGFDDIQHRQNLRYYRTPNQQLFLICDSEIVEVSIFDISGRKLINSPYNSGGMDVSLLAKGVYILKAVYRKGEETIKIIL